MFTYEYLPASTPEGPWRSRANKPYKSFARAKAAADKWANLLAVEGCPVQVRVFELVADGRGGMVERV